MSPSTLNRRTFLTATAASALSVGAATPSASAKRSKKKNVLLYVVDDQGRNDAGCYGHPVIRTPGLDELAAGGTMFRNGYCTTPSCSASRSVILTGLYNHANGQFGHEHSFHHFRTFDAVNSLPKRMSQAGYRTMCAGKYHVGPENVYPFDTFERLAVPADMAQRVKPFVTAKDDKPFFLYFCTTEPHRPFRRKTADPVDPKDVIVPDYLPDLPETREELAQYYMSTQQADAGLVELIKMLKESGHWDDTLIIYISDNGAAFPGAKTCMYEPGINLPCVVRHPGAKKTGMTTGAFVNWADITPTIIEYAGVGHSPTEFHGRSMLPVLEDEHPEGWDEVFASHTFHEITMYYPVRVVRKGRYKLTWNLAHGLDFPFASDLWASKTWQATLEGNLTHYGKRTVDAYLKRPQWELYDLEADPHEVNNLADDASHADVLKTLKARLAQFQKATNDPWIVKWQHE